MRKLLVLLLISLLSLQASWAVAASYCRHEQGAAAKHFGHHEHQHEAAASAPGDRSATGIKLHDSAARGMANPAGASLEAAGDSDMGLMAGVDLDVDCGVCQAHALAGMPCATSPAVIAAAPRAGVPPLLPRLMSVAPPRPERPNWQAV